MVDVNPQPKRRRAKPAKRAWERRRREAVRLAVFERDHWTCQLASYSDCFGVLTPHHVRKASQGGPYTEDNLVSLCSHHNDEIEADADLAAFARSVGLVKRAGDS